MYAKSLPGNYGVMTNLKCIHCTSKRRVYFLSKWFYILELVCWKRIKNILYDSLDGTVFVQL